MSNLKELNNDVSERCREEINRLGIRGASFVQKTGLSKQLFSAVMNGVNSAPTGFISALCMNYPADVSYIITGIRESEREVYDKKLREWEETYRREHATSKARYDEIKDILGDPYRSNSKLKDTARNVSATPETKSDNKEMNPDLMDPAKVRIKWEEFLRKADTTQETMSDEEKDMLFMKQLMKIKDRLIDAQEQLLGYLKENKSTQVRQ